MTTGCAEKSTALPLSYLLIFLSSFPFFLIHQATKFEHVQMQSCSQITRAQTLFEGRETHLAIACSSTNFMCNQKSTQSFTLVAKKQCELLILFSDTIFLNGHMTKHTCPLPWLLYYSCFIVNNHEEATSCNAGQWPPLTRRKEITS